MRGLIAHGTSSKTTIARSRNPWGGIEMKHLFFIGRNQLLVAVSLANLPLPILQAESRCPGSAASATPRFIQRALIVIPVRINQTGPTTSSWIRAARLRLSTHLSPWNSTSSLKEPLVCFQLSITRRHQ